MPAYYNEHDPFAAAWLRELIKAGHIAPGEVDERSIEDVLPSDLREFTQCHFFAGIGVWSYALRRAGWPDDRQVWTGSCPCQPFSAAGKKTGTSDERHLWPALYHLVSQRRPVAFFGEQVASKDGLAWLDTVHSDLEKANYAVGVSDLCSAGFGAPHIRQRLYFVAESEQFARGQERKDAGRCDERGRTQGLEQRSLHGGFRELANSDGIGTSEKRPERSGQLLQPREDEIATRASTLVDTPREQVGLSGQSRLGRETGGGMEVPESNRRDGALQPSEREEIPRTLHASSIRRMANPNNSGLEGRFGMPERSVEQSSGPGGLVNGRMGVPDSTRSQPGNSTAETARQGHSSLTAGFWVNPEWVFCRDGKFRPIESVSPAVAAGLTGELGLVRLVRDSDDQNESEETLVFAPLVTRGKNRVGRLRGYGNALTAEVAKGFIESYLEVERGL